MNELIFLINKVVISGAVIGAIYAMGAIGVTLIFSILRFAHFAGLCGGNSVSRPGDGGRGME